MRGRFLVFVGLFVRRPYQEVATKILHHALDLPFVIALAGTSKPVGEQVVRLKLGEHSYAPAPAVS